MTDLIAPTNLVQAISNGRHDARLNHFYDDGSRVIAKHVTAHFLLVLSAFYSRHKESTEIIAAFDDFSKAYLGGITTTIRDLRLVPESREGASP
jgi:hypothetical protein